jgi:NADH:ubiquinone oxidoreductase subunit E
VAGCLCRDKCKYGPIVTTDGKVHFRFRPDMLPLLLTKRDE